jgi:predicted dehydrogenase
MIYFLGGRKMTNLSQKPVSAIIVGAGHRSLLYASYAEQYPEQLTIEGVVDPDSIRRSHAATRFGLKPNQCFSSLEELVAGERIADTAINGTMDALHVETTIPLLRAGYDVLLEKPIGISSKEVLELLEEADKNERKVMVCHVLRYAPFYAEIRERIASGQIGDILHIQSEENVSYHHMAMAYVRGKWSNKKHGKSSMLMAKSCHDLDIITWMMGGVVPINVGSFGGLNYFRPEMAPPGSGTRCLTDCQIESSCMYSAKKHYTEQGLWKFYVWHGIEHINTNPTLEQKLESLRTDNPYGRCVWRCDNDVVDHQTVAVEFANGATAVHSMVGGTAKPCRTLHIIGTKGEIYGVMEDGFFTVRHPDARAGKEYTEEKVELVVSNDMHGGGDLRLVSDFLRMVRGEQASISTTSLQDSVYGHMIGFAADQARIEKTTKKIHL